METSALSDRHGSSGGPDAPARWEIAALLSIVLVFFGVMLTVGSHTPPVWQDEVQCVDPSANLYLGNGFVSAAHDYRSTKEPALGTPMLYHGLIYAWICLFGFGIESVRSFNYLVAGLTVVVLWAAVGRSGLIRRPAHRLLLAGMLLLGGPLASVYMNNRYDSVGVLVLAVAAWGLTLPARWYRRTLLAVCGLLLAASGLHLIPYAAILSVAAVGTAGRRVVPDLAAAAVGGLCGLAVLLGLLHWYGVLPALWRSIQHHGGTGRLAGRINIALRGMYAIDRWHVDVLAAGLALSLLSGRVRRRLSRRSPQAIGIAFAVCVPVVMGLAGRYYDKYAWMAFIPVAVCTVAALEAAIRHSPFWRWAVVGLVGLVCLIGLPVPVAFALIEWDQTDYAHVDRFVRANVQPGDVLYCSYLAYYPARSLPNEMWVGTGIESLTAEDAARINLVIVKPVEDFQEEPAAQQTLEKLGGRWQRVDCYERSRSRIRQVLWPPPRDKLIRRLEVYRRVDHPQRPSNH